MKKQLLLIVMLLSEVANAFAVEVEIDGLWYDVTTKTKTATVIRYKGWNYYSGDIVISESVEYNGVTCSVTSIEKGAFYGCPSLKSVTIPNSVTSIGASAFQKCSSLTSVTIPNSVTSIGEQAFVLCSRLNSVIVDAKNTVYDSRNNCNAIIETASNTLITGCKNTIIPNSVTSIGDYAFQSCSGLTSVTIPNSVTSIGNSAFYSCSGLTSVTIPNSVTSIGNCAFIDCSKLESVIIGTGVLTIGSDVFSHRPAKVIWLTNTPPSGYTAARGTVNYVANNLYTQISNKTEYPFLSSLFEVDGVKYVPVSPSERTCDAIDCRYDEAAENIHIGKTVTNQGITLTVKQLQPYAFYNNESIKNVVINNTGYVGNCAFQNCTAIETATIGENITTLGSYVFDGCSSLKSIIVPNAVKTIGKSAFQNCTAMETVKMGTGVKSIETYTFSGCSSLSDMQIGSNVETINTYAFSNCTSLPIIRIPRAVTDIKNSVFYQCTGLKTVIMDDREKVLNLGSNRKNNYDYGNPLFSDCPLDSVYIGGNISYNTNSNYGYSPFYRNTSLRTVVITDKETEISENEFYGCTNLQDVKIGDGVESIGNWAFSGCSSLDYFAFGSALKTIGKEAFSDCASVTKIISKATEPPTCGSQALDDINKWTCTLYIPEGCTSAYQNAEQWKEFFFISEGDGGIETPDTPEDKKCATPTMSLKDGKLVFECETEDVEFHCSIKAVDAKEMTGNDIELSMTYIISFYATKAGYEDSDTATQEIKLSNGKRGDVNEDGVIDVADVVTVVNIILEKGDADASRTRAVLKENGFIY